MTPSLFAGSVTCVGQHHYMPDIAIIPRGRFSRRPNCLSMYKQLLSILSQTHTARKSRSLHFNFVLTCGNFIEIRRAIFSVFFLSNIDIISFFFMSDSLVVINLNFLNKTKWYLILPNLHAQKCHKELIFIHLICKFCG